MATTVSSAGVGAENAGTRGGLLDRLPSGMTAGTIQRLSDLVTTAGGERERLNVVTPLTMQPIGHVPRCVEADVEEAVRRARAAQPRWAERSIRERAAVFLRLHDLVLARQEEVLDLIQLESGKSRRHAVEEALDVANVTRYYGVRGEHFLRPRRRKGALPILTSTWELRHPIGVIGFISPWNFPLILAITDAIPALIAGNAAVLKPDQQSSFTALWALQLFREAGLPADVCQIVTGPGAELGPHILSRVDFAMFTGGNETGRTIAKQAAERLIGYSLELGGKNPMIVLEDADLDAAVENTVKTCFVGMGQVCVSIERVFVARPIFDRFAARLAARTQQLRIGSGLDYDTDVGSLATPKQLATVEEHVRDAQAHGATVLTGGRARPDLGPLFYEPTLLTGVREGMKVYREETFGPVVALYPFDSVDEAIARANDTRFGLNAAVWSGNRRRGMEVARRLQAGSVSVNEGYAATWGSIDSPIGGMKESGFGRRHGAEGILKYTEAQTIAVQRWLPVAGPRGTPGLRYARVMTMLMRLMRRIPGLR